MHDIDDKQNAQLARRMSLIRHKLLVLSGKGGVGKSTVAVNLAAALAEKQRVGLLDADIHRPSIPTMLGIEKSKLLVENDAIQPHFISDRLVVMSIGLLLSRKDEAVIWRGPMKLGAIKQFLSQVEWGNLDYLIVDSPPGTGDEPFSIIQPVAGLDGAILVTTPQKVSAREVARSVTFCRRLGVRVLGVVENMSGFICPRCGCRTDIFGVGGGMGLARDLHLPFLGAIQLECELLTAGDQGEPVIGRFPESAAASAFRSIVAKLQEELATPTSPRESVLW